MTPVQVISPPGEIGGTPRYYVSESSSTHKYMLPADEEERERLNVQSQSIIQTFDNRLIWAPVTLKDGDVILDSGTGSGHWLLSLAKEIPPTVDLRGIDISPRMFPPPSSIPPNATFTSLSITSLPDNWSNTISLVHQRLLMAALQEEQWKAAISEMYRVVVPGGWIQLFEANHNFVSPSEAIREHKALLLRNKLSFEVRHIVIDIVHHLQTWLEQAGFVNVKIEKRGLPLGSWAGELGVSSSKSTLAFFHGIKGPVLQEGGFGMASSEEEYNAIIDDLTKLCEETPETYFEYWVFVAQKPDA